MQTFHAQYFQRFVCTLIQKSLSIITYEPVEVCDGVCICGDPCPLFFMTFLGVNLWVAGVKLLASNSPQGVKVDQTNWPSYITVSGCYSALCLLCIQLKAAGVCLFDRGRGWATHTEWGTNSRQDASCFGCIHAKSGGLPGGAAMFISALERKSTMKQSEFFCCCSLHGYHLRDSLSSITFTLGGTTTALFRSLSYPSSHGTGANLEWCF